MTREQMREWLKARYAEQALEFPLLRQAATEQQYIAANLPGMQRSSYWKQKEQS